MKSIALLVAACSCFVTALVANSEQRLLNIEFTPRQYTIEESFVGPRATEQVTFTVDHDANKVRIDYHDSSNVQFFDGNNIFVFDSSPSGIAACKTIKTQAGTIIPHYKENIGVLKDTRFVYGKLVEVFYKESSRYSPETTTYLDASSGYFVGKRGISGGASISFVVKSFVPAIDSNELRIPYNVECREASLNEVDNMDAMKMLLRL